MNSENYATKKSMLIAIDAHLNGAFDKKLRSALRRSVCQADDGTWNIGDGKCETYWSIQEAIDHIIDTGCRM